MNTEAKLELISAAWQVAMSYPQYRTYIDDRLKEGKTTGPQESENYLEYTKINMSRMNKWDKHYAPQPAFHHALQELPQPEKWLVLSEGWCGDAAHSLPLFHCMAEESQGKVELGIVLRDENLALMDAFLTRGGRSIPKLIRTNKAQTQILGTWGPRPIPAQNILEEFKAQKKSGSDINKALQKWYAKDKGKTIETELQQTLTTVITP
ncbi:MAG: thioredoxin family protein [Schleiferiaceae bacterium]|nr:thioredoxin family protein [Schleiferiaceae bacterium]MDR9441797.1 thioredoxin family protein [Schleiferiaceae bacterium]